jgi:hypothetical protein
MSGLPDLKIDWCDAKAARFACERWHYFGGRIPTFKQAKLGVWEDGKFVGAMMWGRGSSAKFCQGYSLQIVEVAELTRVALSNHHRTPTSRIVRIGLRIIVRQNPKLRLLVSFADPAEGHVGTIYQASGWIYTGISAETVEYLYRGRWSHVKAVYGPGRDSGEVREKRRERVRSLIPSLPVRKRPGRYRYLIPLDERVRAIVESRRLPYPKRVGSVDGDTPDVQSGEGGSIPTPALDRKSRAAEAASLVET